MLIPSKYINETPEQIFAKFIASDHDSQYFLWIRYWTALHTEVNKRKF